MRLPLSVRGLSFGLSLALAALATGCVGAPDLDDDDGEVREAASAEGGNLPDYVVRNLNASCAGGTVTVTFDVVNVGPVGGGAWSNARMWIDGAPRPFVGTPPLGASGGFAPYTLIESGLAAGLHHAHAMADASGGAGGVIAESNEGNNSSPVVGFVCP
jgi:hypothetical protein